MAASLPHHVGIAFAALVLCAVVPSRCDYCTKLTRNAGDKPLPEFNVETYIIEYKATFIDKGYSMWAKESYDYGFLRLDSKAFGLEQAILISDPENSHVSWEYLDSEKKSYNCKEQELGTMKRDKFDMFGSTKPTDGNVTVVTASQVLNNIRDMGYVYIGEEIIDGLPVDHWQSCQRPDDINAIFTLDYYFTTEDYKPIDTLAPSQIPVRAEIEGEIIKNGKTVSIHHIYDYLKVRVLSELPPETYSYPDFMECQFTYPSTNLQPVIPDYISMAYTVETVVHTPTDDGSEKVTVDVKTVYRDDQRQLVRVDSGKTTSISDFKLGTEFLIDDDGCTARVIDPKNVPWAIKDSNNYIKMGQAPEIAYLNSKDMFHTGAKTYRDFWVYGFAKVTANEEFEMFFEAQGLTPVAIRSKSLITNVETYYNFFNFLQFFYLPEEDPFHIRGCEGDRTRVDYRITLKSVGSSYYSDFTDYLPQIVEELRDHVASIAGVSVLQIAPYNSIAIRDDIYLYVSYIGLPRSTPQAKVRNGLPVKTEREIVSAVQGAINDNTFKYSITLGYFKYDFIAVASYEDSALITGFSNPLELYSQYKDKCDTDFDFTETSYETSALACADKCKNNYDLSCIFFQFTETTKTCQMSAESVSPTLSNAIGCDSFALMAQWQFTRFASTVLVRTADATIETGDANECARRCLDERSFNCESFDLCEEDKKCALHATHYYSEESNPEKDKSKYSKCHHYSRFSLYDYNYQGQLEIVYPENQIQTTVSNGMECAYMCTDYSGEGCSMYTICSADVGDVKKFTCNLITASMEASVQTTTNTNCFLYKRKGIPSGTSLYKASSAGQKNENNNYTGGQLTLLAISMILTGMVAGALTVFLLSWFNVWNGFN